MNSKTTRVFNGWLELSAAERRELSEEIRRYERSADWQKRSLRENVSTKVSTGPLAGSCPCCGR